MSFVLLPEGEDPDNLIKTQGVNAIKSLINVAEPLSEILWRISKKGYRLETPEDRAGFDKRLREMALLIQDKTVQKYYLNSFDRKRIEKQHQNRRLVFTSSCETDKPCCDHYTYYSGALIANIV